MRRLAVGAALVGVVAVVGLGQSANAQSSDTETPRHNAAFAKTDPSDEPFDDAAAERDTRARLGVDDIRVVSEAVADAASGESSSSSRTTDATALSTDFDGGLTYDDFTLTFTQWIVAAEGSDAVRADARKAFEETAGDSNLTLKIATTTVSQQELENIGRSLIEAYRTDPAWPRGMPLTGAPDPATGTYMLEAGELASDSSVSSYFARGWPGQVTLSSEAPAQLEAEGRRTDSPSNGWNGGVAMCSVASGEPCAKSSAPDVAGCTGGFAYITNGRRGMLTAGHCVNPYADFAWRRYSEPRYTIGHNSSAETTSRSDSAFIRQSTYPYRNWIWIGGRYGTGQREITATEYWPRSGDKVYFSGGNTGWQSGQVAASYVTLCEGMPTRFVSGLKTMGGDSGSPVVMPNTDTTTTGDYKAVGIHVCGKGQPLVEGWRRMTIMGTINSTLGGYPATY